MRAQPHANIGEHAGLCSPALNADVLFAKVMRRHRTCVGLHPNACTGQCTFTCTIDAAWLTMPCGLARDTWQAQSCAVACAMPPAHNVSSGNTSRTHSSSTTQPCTQMCSTCGGFAWRRRCCCVRLMGTAMAAAAHQPGLMPQCAQADVAPPHTAILATAIGHMPIGGRAHDLWLIKPSL